MVLNNFPFYKSDPTLKYYEQSSQSNNTYTFKNEKSSIK